MTGTVPEVVVKVVEAATAGGLLSGADALSTGLLELGWGRTSSGGYWRWDANPEVGAWTSVTPPTVLVQLGGDDAVMREVYDVIASRLQDLLGEPTGHSQAGDVDRTSAWWERTADAVAVDFTPSTSELVGFAPGRVPFASTWIKVERLDVDGLAAEQDADRARRLARHGSPVERWYVAGQAVLPPDVVEVLEADEDPAVATTVRRGSRRRAYIAAHPGSFKPRRPDSDDG